MKRVKFFFIQTSGQFIVELLIACGLAAVILPALLTGMIASRQAKSQQYQRTDAVGLLRETEDIVRNIRDRGWSNVTTNGTYHPVISGTQWNLAAGSETLSSGLVRSVVIGDANRDTTGAIVPTPTGSIDPSTKRIDISVSWTTPTASSTTSTLYLTRFRDNLSFTQTTAADFTADTRTNVDVTNTSGGEATLSVNTKAKWCTPTFSTSTIDLPDGPPVAVSARSSKVSAATPNDVFVGTSPTTTESAKLAYVQVTANTDPPVSTLRGTFTMDSNKYSNSSYFPTGTGLDNSFRTNDVKYYTSSSGKLYALIATTKPDKEVIAIQINNGSTDSFQDPVNKIYKYWTFFNTRRYQGDNSSTPNQDQAPFGYGAVSLTVLGNTGYVVSGGYLYAFDLSNIDSKSAASGLDMVGCRIELDGYDCSPGTGTDKKYNAGQTGTSWGNTTSPAHNDCSDGGNIELYADNSIYPVQVGANTYIYVAVGAGTNPELDIANVTTVPTNSTSPKINNSSCGTIANGASGWKRISSLDFNTKSNSEEAANSVYAKSDGTRAYVSSNGGIFAGGGPNPDSWQFYVIDTSNKSAPKFLSGTSSTGATSGYYYGSSVTINGVSYHNDQLFPRRSLTVLNGQRAVLVGKNGFTNGNDTLEYQVLDITSEAAPSYCGGVNFDAGFNDLTSVSEADGDNFVYMVVNTKDKQLKIIQGGPDGTYLDTGTLESSTLDVGYSTVLNRFSSTTTIPANTTLQFQFAGADAVSGSCTGATYAYIGPDGTASTYYAASGAPIFVGSAGSYKNPARCFRYKAFFSTTDYNATSILKDITINYSP